MRFHFNQKKFLVLRKILFLFSIIYLTSIILYLEKMKFIVFYRLDEIVFKIYFTLLILVSIRIFFKNIFLNEKLEILAFLPLKFETILFLEIRRVYSYILTVSISYLISLLIIGTNWLLAVKNIFLFLINESILNLFILQIVLKIIYHINLKQSGVIVFEKILSIMVIFVCSVVNIEYINIYMFPIILLTVLFLLRRDEYFYKVIYNKLINNISTVDKYQSIRKNKYKFLDCVGRNIYLTMELKRYMKIYKFLFPSLIQLVISSIVMLGLYYSRGINAKMIFILIINFIVANNTFATTSWSSESDYIYKFFPIYKWKMMISKIIVSSIIQTVVVTILYSFFVLFGYLDKETVYYGYIIIFFLTPVYSVFGTILDFLMKKKVDKTSELLYGNLPKICLILISQISSKYFWILIFGKN